MSTNPAGTPTSTVRRIVNGRGPSIHLSGAGERKGFVEGGCCYGNARGLFAGVEYAAVSPRREGPFLIRPRADEL
jgi:hypothetical protein